MKYQFLVLILLAVSLLGCNVLPTPVPPTPAATPTVAAQPAVTTLAATLAPTSAPVAAATVAPTVAPTQAPPAATQPAVTEPTVLQRFNLLPLPGAGRSPAALAQLGSTVYVANRASDNIAVIRDRQVRSLIPTARSPVALATDAANARLYVGTYISPTIALIQNDAVVRTVSLSGSVESLAFTPENLLVGLTNAPVIELRDPQTLAKKSQIKLSKGFGVMSLVLDAPRHRLYAGVYDYVVMLDLDTLKELGTISVPSFFGSLAVNPNDGNVWAGGYDSNGRQGVVSAFNANGQQLRQIPLDSDLRGSAFDDAGHLFVPSSFMNRVSVVDAANGNVLKQVPVGLGPIASLLDGANHVVYIANGDGDSVAMIDSQSLNVVATIPLGMRVTALIGDEQRNRVYAANGSTASVFVIENGRVVNQVSVGHHPIDLARDPKTNRLFVADYADGAVNVIDENSLTVQATLPITRYLSTVAVDPVNRHLMAGSTMLNLDSKAPEGLYLAQGMGMMSRTAAQLVRVDPARGKIYAVASNGIPGSNSRVIPYRFTIGNPDQSTALPNPPAGNVTALAIDLETGQVYAGITHPLAYNNALVVWDASGKLVSSLSMQARTAGLEVNPRTHHLLLSHSGSYIPYGGAAPARDNTVQILDTRTLGEVGWLDVPGAPGPMTRLGDAIYVASRDDGAITLIRDVATAQPAAPTPTPTPSPYPTLTPTSPAPTAPARTATPTPRAVTFTCSFDPGAPFQDKYNSVRAQLGCASGKSEARTFAFQPFQSGFMLADFNNPAGKQIYVFIFDGTYKQFPDTFVDGMPEDSCPQVTLLNGLLKPKRGFGKVWCFNKDVQGKLPGATIEEAEVNVAMQQFERGMIWTFPNINTFALFNNGTWR